jgi:PKD repeat protein
MKLIAATCLMAALLVAGCPSTDPTTTSAVTAVIGYSVLQGRAPLTVTFAGTGSSSLNGGTLTYVWDFADGSTSDQAALTHTFTHPGRYNVQLRVTDETGATNLAAADVRAQGSAAVAAIGTNVSSGPAPLTVQFDGTVSYVPDDTILDYYWDFGDGGTSRDAKPAHTFQSPAGYTVSLRIITAGGLESRTTTGIAVDKRVASLQFNGANFATLPLGNPYNTVACTVEAWVRAENEGGTVLSVGSGAITVDLRPTANTLGLRANGVALDATASQLAGSWRHLAVVYDGGTAAVAVLYLDGSPIGRVTVTGPISMDRLSIGIGLRGKIGEVRFWSGARSNAAILSTINQRLTGSEIGLLGYWPLDAGSGQSLANLAVPASPGTLGSTTAPESSDPAWSTEGPPL